jgi:hypothetical protein
LFQLVQKLLEAEELMLWIDETFTTAIRSAHSAFSKWNDVLKIVDTAMSSAGVHFSTVCRNIAVTYLNVSVRFFKPRINATTSYRHN